MLVAFLLGDFKRLLGHDLVELEVDPLIDGLGLREEGLVGLVEDLIGRLHQHLIGVRALLELDDIKVLC